MSLQRVLRDLDLGWRLAKQDLSNRYARSYAGAAWSVGIPLFSALTTMVVFSILMSGRMGERYEDVAFPVFFFIPFSLWVLFSDVVMRSTAILQEYGYLVRKVAFPFWVVPLIPLASALLNQAIVLAIAFILMIHYDVAISSSAPLYLLIWLITLVISIGFSYSLSSLSVFVPDLGQLIPILVTILFWLTPILYPATIVESAGSVWQRSVIMYFNPMYYIVESSRFAFIGSEPTDAEGWVYMSFVAIVSMLIGVFLFRRLRAGFADVL